MAGTNFAHKSDIHLGRCPISLIGRCPITLRNISDFSRKISDPDQCPEVASLVHTILEAAVGGDPELGEVLLKEGEVLPHLGGGAGQRGDGLLHPGQG